jgi:predicted transposase/invertase (TIGR01784 family)
VAEACSTPRLCQCHSGGAPIESLASATQPQPTRADVVPRYMHDIVFKRLFACMVLLCSLLNSLLRYEGDDRIVDLSLLPTEMLPSGLNSKRGVLDLRARDQLGRQFNIEVQHAVHGDIITRSLTYVAHLLLSQAQRGDPYTGLRPNVGIVLTDACLFPQHNDVHTPANVYAPRHGFVVSDLMEWHFFELGKLPREAPSDDAPMAMKWLHMLHYGHRYSRGGNPLPPSLAAVEEIVMALDQFTNISQDESVREALFQRMLDERDYATDIRQATQAGRAEGLTEGKRETARSLRDLGIDLTVIATATGLDPAEIRAL